jgi:alkylation response protein AidB-like acyl-CoA dehydrogenase
MMIHGTEAELLLDPLIEAQLKPYVKQIDAEAYYAANFLKSLGLSGLLQSQHAPEAEVLSKGAQIVEQTAKVCMTTAFNAWCHLAALTYVRKSDNVYLRQTILPKLESGETLGGTGLSNPMKFYAGLEKVHLQATRTSGGYIFSGQLRAVSNLGPNHWFGVVARINNEQRVMAMISCQATGLELKEKLDYIGLNGSATYSCCFHDVYVPDEWIVAEQADDFIFKIRPLFVMYQIPLGLGVTSASIRSIEQATNKQCGANSYLRTQAADLRTRLNLSQQRYEELVHTPDLGARWKAIIALRLDLAYLTLEAVQACMLHQGGAAYLKQSDASRRLREAYFFANLTPTIKHLEKMLR